MAADLDCGCCCSRPQPGGARLGDLDWGARLRVPVVVPRGRRAQGRTTLKRPASRSSTDESRAATVMVEVESQPRSRAVDESSHSTAESSRSGDQQPTRRAPPHSSCPTRRARRACRAPVMLVVPVVPHSLCPSIWALTTAPGVECTARATHSSCSTPLVVPHSSCSPCVSRPSHARRACRAPLVVPIDL